MFLSPDAFPWGLLKLGSLIRLFLQWYAREIRVGPSQSKLHARLSAMTCRRRGREQDSIVGSLVVVSGTHATVLGA